MDNPFLFAALMVSLFIGLVGGIGGCVGLFLLLKRYSVKFWMALEHRRRY